MNRILNFGIVALGIGILFSSLNNSALAQEVKDGIYEDQAIICVNGHVVEQKGNICHVFNTDDLDWYQVISDGSLFDLKDSFDMSVVD